MKRQTLVLTYAVMYLQSWTERAEHLPYRAIFKARISLIWLIHIIIIDAGQHILLSIKISINIEDIINGKLRIYIENCIKFGPPA